MSGISRWAKYAEGLQEDGTRDRWSKYAAPDAPSSSRWAKYADQEGDSAAAVVDDLRARDPGGDLVLGESAPPKKGGGPLRDLGRQGARHVAEGVYATATGLANLTKLIPGADDFAEAAVADLKADREEMREYYGDPEGLAGILGAVAGRVGSETLQLIGSGSLVRKGVGALARAGKLPALARAVAPASTRAGQVAQDVALGAPFDITIASAGPDDSVAGGFAEITQERFPDASRAFGAVAENPVTRAAFEVATSATGAAGLAATGSMLARAKRALDVTPEVDAGLEAGMREAAGAPGRAPDAAPAPRAPAETATPVAAAGRAADDATPDPLATSEEISERRAGMATEAPPKEMARYENAVLQSVLEDARIAGAGSPVRVKVDRNSPDLAGIGAVGTGQGAFARGRLTQATRRADAAAGAIRAAGADVPDPDVAFLRGAERDPSRLPGDLADELPEIRAMADDELDRAYLAAEDQAYYRREDMVAQSRRALLAGEIRARGREIPELELAGAQGPRGFIDVATVGRGIRKFFRRNLTSAGDLPREVFQKKIRAEGRIGSVLRQMDYTLGEFSKAAKAAYVGERKMSVAHARQLDGALKGEIAVELLPEPMQPVIRKMRAEIDALSRRLIDEGVVEGDLVARVTDNLGVYATRSYRVFDDPLWASKVPAEVRNRAKALLRSEFPNRTEEQIEGLIEELLYKIEDGPVAILARGGKLGSKDLSTLTKRKDISPEIRALWGEYTDPRVNYARSVAKMARLIENHRFLSDVKEEGLGRIFFTEPVVQDGERFVKQIAAEGSRTMEPLNGLYTTPEIERAFREALEPEAAPDWLRHYMKVNGAVKFSKTILSVMTQVRNLVSNVGFATANGHWRAAKMGPATRTTLANLGALDRAAFRDYYRELTELGVVGESTRAGELQDVIRDALSSDLDRFADSIIERGVRKGLKAAQQLYQAEDDVWKVFAYENELARYRKALPDVPAEDVKRMAAENVRNTYPTYSLVPRAVKLVRRFPLVGTFVSFPAEVARTAYNTIDLIRREMADPRLRRIGTERLAGALVAAGGVGAATTASRHLVGVTLDEDRDLRRFLPPWARNSSLLHLAKKEDGRRVFIDLSYTDPYSYLRKPLVALMRGEDWEDAIIEAVVEASSPFFGEEILAGKLLDISRNQKRDGGRVYNPEDTFPKKLEDVFAHLYDALEPGTLASMKRIEMGLRGKQTIHGRSYDPRQEAIAVLTGHRIQELDPRQSLSFRSSESARQIADAERILRSVAGRRGTVTDEELRAAYTSMERARERRFREAHDNAMAAIRLGVPEYEVEEILVASRFSRREAQDILAGIYTPYEPSDRYLAGRGDERMEEEYERRRWLLQGLADAAPEVPLGPKERKSLFGREDATARPGRR